MGDKVTQTGWHVLCAPIKAKILGIEDGIAFGFLDDRSPMCWRCSDGAPWDEVKEEWNFKPGLSIWKKVSDGYRQGSEMAMSSKTAATFEEWMEAALTMAEVEGMSDDTVIPTWPADVVQKAPEKFPELTIGALREWTRSHCQPVPHARLEVMGNISIDEAGDMMTYPKALVITFQDVETIRDAINRGACTFSMEDRER